MSIRSLEAQIKFKDHATQALEGVDSQMDGIKDNVEGVQSGFSDLSQETGEFAYSARSDMQDVGSSVDELGHKTGGFRTRMSGVADAVGRNWNRIAAGAAAAGAAIEAVIRSQQDLELATEQTAIAMSESSESVREMVGSMTDHTFSTEDALSGAQRLIQSGYDQEEQMKVLLPLFDELSDATGIDMVQGIDMVDRAFSAMGKDLMDVEDHMDTFTWLQTQTTVGMQEFGQLMRREAPALRDMGLGVEDAAIAMAALEAEGIRGPRAVMGFQDAIGDAEGDLNKFWESLAVSADTLEEQQSRLAGAKGLTSELSDAYADNFTWLQKQQAELEQLNYRYGDIIGTIDWLSPALMGLGTAMGIAAAAKFLGIGAAATLGVTIAGVTAPLWLVVAAVGAVAGGIYMLWTRVDWFRDAITSFAETIADTWSYVTSGIREAWEEQSGIIGGIAWYIEYAIEWYSNLWETVRNTVTWIVEQWQEGEGLIGTTLRQITSGFALAFETIWGVVEVAATAIWGIFTGDFEPLHGAFSSLVDNILGRWGEMTDNIVSWLEQIDLLQTGRDIVDGLISGITDRISGVRDAVTGVADTIRGSITDFFGIASPSQLMIEYGHNMGEGLQLGLEQESRNFFSQARQMFTPDRDRTQATGGNFAPVVNIEVNGGSDPERIASAVDRRIRQTFDRHAETYFSRQRRRR